MAKSQVLMKALRVARKKLPILGDKALNQNLSYFCGDYAEAYRAGAEEAQQEIVRRLECIRSTPGEPRE